MTQNTSHAVMAQRREPHSSLEHFPTPPWATRALCNWLETYSGCLDKRTAWEPACGSYDMVRPLREYFGHVSASDVHAYGPHPLHDFLMPGPAPVDADWIVTNPPFRLAEKFVHRALELAHVGCAFLMRTSFLEGGGRWRNLFRHFPPSDVLIFSERVPMLKGRLDREASSATSYSWFVWDGLRVQPDFPRLQWLPPGTRKACESPFDYKAAAE